MKIKLVSIPVRDQEKALQFYTAKLGFIKKHDIPLGGANRWLTLVSAEDQEGPELLLEPAPNHFKPSKIYQNALFEAGIPVTQFNTDDIQSEYERLTELDVVFSKTPTDIWYGENSCIQ